MGKTLDSTKHWRHGWWVVIWLLFLPACATVNMQDQPQSQLLSTQAPAAVEIPPAQNSSGRSYWWYVPVQVAWPEQQPTAWYVDILLAHQLFKPLLIEYAQHIQLWRFHRRAVRDRTGHRFSFIFYAPKPTAMAILDKLAQNTLIPELIAANVIEKVDLPDGNNASNPAVEATSDKNWSLAMQRAWPYFAMGASQVWLGLIDQYVASSAQTQENPLTDSEALETVDIEALAQFYQTIDQKMVVTWETEGGHALLHHLNALFGYGEVAIYERRMMRF